MIYLCNILREKKLKGSERSVVSKNGSFNSKDTCNLHIIDIECRSDLYFAGQSGKQL